MAITKHLPIDATAPWLGDGTIPVKIMLLTATTTSIGEALDDITDLHDWEVPTGGGYTAGGQGGIDMPPLTRVPNAAADVVEYSTGTATWTSTSSYTVDSFRWVAASTNGLILAIWDSGAEQSLTNEPLVLTVAQSTDTTGAYPILRLKRFLG